MKRRSSNDQKAEARKTQRNNSSSNSKPVNASEDADYSSVAYWEKRYQDKGGYHEWYFSYEILEPILLKTFSSQSSILELGCGDSPLAPKLSSAGHAGRIAAIDFSQEIVDKMIAENTSSVVYAKMDARKLEYDSSEFDCVIDKGTCDAMLCDKRTGFANVKRIMTEAVRVLRKDGSIILVSHLEADSEKFELVMEKAILPALGSSNSVRWKITAHQVEPLQGESSATVYVMQSRERRFTRTAASGNQGHVEFEVLSYGNESDCDDD